MSLDFDKYKLSEFCTFSYGKMPKKDRILNDPTKYPIFSGYQIVGYYDEYNIDKNELILIARGVGGTGDVKLTPAKCFLTNLSIAFSINQTYALTKFLYYYFQVNNLKYLDSGSAQSQITINNLKQVEVQLPPLNVQSKIIEIIDTLDVKIKINKEINKNLEGLVKSIYRYHFIDFKPYLSAGYAKDCKLDLIPKDWSVQRIEDFVDEMKNGGTPKRGESDYWENGTVPWLKTGEINNDVIIKSDEYITELGLKNSSAKLLPINSVIMALYGKGTAGRVGLLKFEATTNQACCAMICHDINKSLFIYLYLLLKQKEIESLAIGSIQQNLSKDTISNIEMVVPPMEIFEKLPFKEIFDTIENNCLEIEYLTNLRDILLPQLMSGEIDVSEINCDLKGWSYLKVISFINLNYSSHYS